MFQNVYNYEITQCELYGNGKKQIKKIFSRIPTFPGTFP